ncbi:MAG: deoxyribodipyrimidine photo-lyase, partial [Hyphomicrobiales bacterium]|nr:deoxyribodipyrimidine photo-lyase [Hyphomicrobiales bacterium]
LVDADPANNAASWQWVAGSGADAAPFFRVFNPVLQGQKFDPHARFAKEFVPELARVPSDLIYRKGASQAEESLFEHPGKSYALPIVDHADGRLRALAAFRSLRE